MRSVFKRLFRVAAMTLLCTNLLISVTLVAETRQRDPSFAERLRTFVRHVIRTFSDDISIPPPQTSH